MSWIQLQEELEYDTQSEYLNVLRMEAFDPYEFESIFTPEEQDEFARRAEAHQETYANTPEEDYLEPPF